jgi:hypothetical protein
MTENRRDLLAALAAAIAHDQIPEVITVVRHYGELDITQYSESQLPLIAIKEDSEEPEEECTGMRMMMWLNVPLKVYFVHWGISPDAAYGTLMKAIRDKIGNDPNLNSSSVFTYVRGVSEIGGEMPLYYFNLDLAVRYYASLKDA